MSRTPHIRRVATACIAFVFAAVFSARAEGTAKPLLWKIEGGKKPSYLFGTIHLTRPAVTTLPKTVSGALDRADAVFTEVPADMATMLGATQKMFLPDGGTLDTILSEELLTKLSAELAAVNPAFTLAAFQRFKPWAIAATLMMLEDQMKYPGALALDMQLFQRAAMAGKQTGGIETIDEQLGIFDAFSQEEQIQMLEETIDLMQTSRAKGESPVQQLVDAYLSGDLARVDAEMAKWNAASPDPELTERFMERLLYKRNVHMAERMAAMIREHPDTGYFFAIGAAHLGGERGVLALLEKAGLKLSRVE